MLDIALLTTNASQLKYLLQVRIGKSYSPLCINHHITLSTYITLQLTQHTNNTMFKVHLLELSHDLRLISHPKVGDGHGFYAVVLGLVIGSILLQVIRIFQMGPPLIRR